MLTILLCLRHELRSLHRQKAETVTELRRAGKVVGMVGDGINDAPALAAADVGFAIGSGTDIAKEAGGIVLMRDDVADVVKAIKLSKRVVRKIKQNLFWALAYNIVLILWPELSTHSPAYYSTPFSQL